MKNPPPYSFFYLFFPWKLFDPLPSSVVANSVRLFRFHNFGQTSIILIKACVILCVCCQLFSQLYGYLNCQSFGQLYGELRRQMCGQLYDQLICATQQPLRLTHESSVDCAQGIVGYVSPR